MMTVRNTTRSCSTLLCARLCSSACGTLPGVEVMNIAVPATRTGGLRISESRNASSGTDDCRSRAIRISRPRRQVTMSRKIAAPTITGNHPPSNIFSRLAEKNAMSTKMKKPVLMAATITGMPHL